MTNNANEMNEKTCYSSEELQEFKELILQKLEKAEENLAILTAAVANEGGDINDTAPTFKLMEEVMCCRKRKMQNWQHAS